MKLIDFLNSLITTSSAGKDGITRKVIKGFDIPRHGVDIAKILEASDPQTRKDERHVAINKMLGINLDDSSKSITPSGKALICQCTDSQALVSNQYKKWRYPRAYNKGVSDTDVYPYWVLLEFLLKVDASIGLSRNPK